MDLGMDMLWKKAALKERYFFSIFEINMYKNLAQVSPVSIQVPFHLSRTSDGLCDTCI